MATCGHSREAMRPPSPPPPPSQPSPSTRFKPHCQETTESCSSGYCIQKPAKIRPRNIMSHSYRFFSASLTLMYITLINHSLLHCKPIQATSSQPLQPQQQLSPSGSTTTIISSIPTSTPASILSSPIAALAPAVGPVVAVPMSNGTGGLQQATPIVVAAPYLFRYGNNQLLLQIVPINSTNMHEPRIELRYKSKYPFVNLDEQSANNTVVAAVVVNDEDTGLNGETTLSIEHGNELGHFKLVNTNFSRTIQVSGAPLWKHRVPEYNLTIVARDRGTPPKSSAVNLVIKLSASAASPQQTAELSPQPNRPPNTDHLFYVGAMLVIIFTATIILLIIGCALIQRPSSKKGPPPPPRATSATTSNPRLYPNPDPRLCTGLSHSHF